MNSQPTNGPFSTGAALSETQKNSILHNPISIPIPGVHSEHHRFLHIVACRVFLFHSQFFSWVRKPQGWLCLHNSIMQGGVMIQIIIIILYVLIWPLHFLFLGLGTIYLIILVLDWTDKFFGKFLLPSSSCQHSPEVLRYPRQGLAVLGKKQFSTFATCARRSVENTGDKMSFTELVLQHKVSSPLPKLCPTRLAFESVLHVSIFQELPGALWPPPLPWAGATSAMARLEMHTEHSTEQLRLPGLHHSSAQM